MAYRYKGIECDTLEELRALQVAEQTNLEKTKGIAEGEAISGPSRDGTLRLSPGIYYRPGSAWE